MTKRDRLKTADNRHGVNTPGKHRGAPIPEPAPAAALPTATTVQKQLEAPPAPRNPNRLQLPNDGRPIAEQKADGTMSPITTNALVTLNSLSFSVTKEDRDAVGIAAYSEVMRQRVKAVTAGDMTGIEEVLASNVFTLNALFAQFANKAQQNIGLYPQAAETYMRMAFRAQSQCRASAETLAEMKNPRPVFINAKQANVTNGNQQVNNAEGPQQVNNGTGPIARVEEKINTNKLLEND